MTAKRMRLLPVLLPILLGAACPALADNRFDLYVQALGYLKPLARTSRTEALAGADLALATGPLASLTNAAPLPEGPRARLEYGTFVYRTYNDFEFDFDLTGAGLEGGGAHLDLVWMRIRSEEIVIRTAYQPEGNGTTFRYVDQYHQANASYDLARLLLPAHPQLQWTVGATGRRHTISVADETQHAWNLDLGTSARLTKRQEQLRFELAGAATWSNVTDATIALTDTLRSAETEAPLPRFRHLGLTASLGADLLDRPGDELTMRMMTAWRTDRHADETDLLWGSELLLADVLSLRFGIDAGRVQQKDFSWGFGVTLPRELTHDFVVGYDFAKLNDDEPQDPDLLEIDGEREVHTVTAGLRW